MSRVKTLLASLTRLQPPDDSPNLPPPLREFTLFVALPVELRLKIWGFAASEVRKIILKEPVRSNSSSRVYSSVARQSRHPSILQVNFEARQAGLQFYERCIENELSGTNNSPGNQGTGDGLSNVVYINFSKDLFLFDCQNRSSQELLEHFNFPASVLNRIERLEVLFDSPLPMNYSPSMCRPSFSDLISAIDTRNLTRWREIFAISPTNTFNALQDFTYTFGKQIVYDRQSLEGELQLRIQTGYVKAYLTLPTTIHQMPPIKVYMKWYVIDSVDIPPNLDGRVKDSEEMSGLSAGQSNDPSLRFHFATSDGFNFLTKASEIHVEKMMREQPSRDTRDLLVILHLGDMAAGEADMASLLRDTEETLYCLGLCFSIWSFPLACEKGVVVRSRDLARDIYIPPPTGT
ncbi:hypothetical protein N431DRAFT_447160 [Stipitochalara longipes BDJ]|nr:hypothetical protein N431DRAFT_447160 [Stipitochalara longipes BDJ]